MTEGDTICLAYGRCSVCVNAGTLSDFAIVVFVGVADLSVLDPVVSGNRPTRNYAYLRPRYRVAGAAADG
jgi:hypothetical protein